ncbi:MULTISPECIES: lipase family protein [Thermomonosporaceae]|uniref:lipase family protein n=1 Tax=Thermomonosporaceae TaxID=2012 RepID=UPI00255ABA34|nr:MULTISPECIES: lipase family protein [Thermomonosporaceae]MDL4773309.1 lipase family protein [Actinomadura xylanilytica]
MSTSVRRCVRAMLACCTGLALTATALQGNALAAPQESQPPAEDPFYKPPSPLPDGKPGDIIRSRPSVFTMDPIGKAPYGGVKSWQVLYRSESVQGVPIAVSGSVLVPDKPWTGGGQRPLVSYTVGTRGLGDSCAPSYTLTQGIDYEELFIADALGKGWAVTVTDMEGLGTPGQHTYEVGGSQGKAVLNMARAAQRLPDAGLGAGPVAVWGYSQGGTSAGWAAELAASYAPELQLKGVVAGGVPADLLAVGKKLDGSAFVALMFMAAVGYDAAYPELKLGGYLNDRGRELLKKAENICLLSLDGASTLIDTSFKKISDYTASDPLATPEWQRRLNANKLGSTAPGVPVFQGQAALDEIIPAEQAETLRRAWCAKGANVTWKSYPLAEHVLGILQSEPDAIAFLTDRFAGKPAQGNCAA